MNETSEKVLRLCVLTVKEKKTAQNNTTYSWS